MNLILYWLHVGALSRIFSSNHNAIEGLIHLELTGGNWHEGARGDDSGTASDGEKSVVVAGLCRAAQRRGIRVAPSRPQNMSNNAAACAAGGEMGRA